MKFTLSRAAALPMLQQAVRTCDLSAIGQPQSEFLFEVVGSSSDSLSRLHVSTMSETSDQTITVPTLEIDAEAGESVSVSADAFLEVVKTSLSDDIRCVFNAEAGMLVIGAGKGKFAFRVGGTKEDFHQINFWSGRSTFEVPGHLLADALSHTFPFADRKQQPLTAVRVRVDGGQLEAVASDNLRIAVYRTVLGDAEPMPHEFMVPRAVAAIIGATVRDVGQVTVHLADTMARFTWQGCSFTTTLETGRQVGFPDVSEFMDGEPSGTLNGLSRGDLERCLKLAKLVAKDSHVTLHVVSGGLQVSASEQDKGISQDLVACADVDCIDPFSASMSVLLSHLTDTVASLKDSALLTLKFWPLIVFEDVGLSVSTPTTTHYLFPSAVNEKYEGNESDAEDSQEDAQEDTQEDAQEDAQEVSDGDEE